MTTQPQQATEQVAEQASVQPTEQKVKLTPEMVNSADIAIKVLISVAELSFKKSLFEDMNDVATINQAKKVAEKFIAYETFKLQNYNQIIKEVVDGEGKVTSTRLTLEVAEKGAIGDFLLETYVVPQLAIDEEAKFYTFINGDLVLLRPGQSLVRVNNFYLVPGFPDLEPVTESDTTTEENLESK